MFTRYSKRSAARRVVSVGKDQGFTGKVKDQSSGFTDLC